MIKKNKKEEIIEQPKGIISTTNGELLEISVVIDEVFSQNMIGDGFAIQSSDGVIVSPVSDSVEMVFDYKSIYRTCKCKR